MRRPGDDTDSHNRIRSQMIIDKLKDIDYNKPFKTNEIQERYKDEASNIISKINELVEAVNSLLITRQENQ